MIRFFLVLEFKKFIAENKKFPIPHGKFHDNVKVANRNFSIGTAIVMHPNRERSSQYILITDFSSYRKFHSFNHFYFKTDLSTENCHEGINKSYTNHVLYKTANNISTNPSPRPKRHSQTRKKSISL